jgi:hypothetical protein
MTRLSKDFTHAIDPNTSPERAFYIGSTFGVILMRLLDDENGRESLLELLPEYPEIKIINF